MSLLVDIKKVLESVEADPLVQVAMNLDVPASTRGALASILATLEADVASVRTAARDEGYQQGQADAQPHETPL